MLRSLQYVDLIQSYSNIWELEIPCGIAVLIGSIFEVVHGLFTIFTILSLYSIKSLLFQHDTSERNANHSPKKTVPKGIIFNSTKLVDYIHSIGSVQYAASGFFPAIERGKSQKSII